jgi:hypothetical protein
MTRSSLWISLPVIAALLSSCADPYGIDLDIGPLLRTDASSYTLTENNGVMEATIPFTYENRTERDLVLEKCRGLIPPILERRSGDEWTAGWVGNDYDCDPAPYTLVAGAVYTDTLHLWAHPFGSEREPQFLSASVTGTYRLQLSNVWLNWKKEWTSRPFGDQLPVELRVSDPFQLSKPPS